jgi:hypothetical protein
MNQSPKGAPFKNLICWHNRRRTTKSHKRDNGAVGVSQQFGVTQPYAICTSRVVQESYWFRVWRFKPFQTPCVPKIASQLFSPKSYMNNPSASQEDNRLLSTPNEIHISRQTWLKERLVLTNAELEKMSKAFPSLLDYRMKENLEPKLDWLQRAAFIG